MSKLTESSGVWSLKPSESWSLVETLDFTDYNIGTLSSGNNTIGGLTWEWVTASGHSATNSSGVGIRQVATGGGNFSYLGREISSLITNVKNPVRFLMSAQNMDLKVTSSNAGIVLSSSDSPDGTRCPSIIVRFNAQSSGAVARKLSSRTEGTVGSNGSYTNNIAANLGSNPTSAVFEIYVWQASFVARIYEGTTTFPAAEDPYTVFADQTNYFQGSMAGYGMIPGATIDWFPDLTIGTMVGGGGGQDADVDWLVYQVEEWG